MTQFRISNGNMRDTGRQRKIFVTVVGNWISPHAFAAGHSVVPAGLAATALLFFSLIAFPHSAAFGQMPKLPRVGIIREPWLLTEESEFDCGNHQLALNGIPVTVPNVVFLSRPDGSRAIMRLNGRERNLKHVRSVVTYNNDEPLRAQHEYRFGKWQIIVTFRDRPGYVTDYPATLVVKRGRMSKNYAVIGLGQCDDD